MYMCVYTEGREEREREILRTAVWVPIALG